MIWFERTGWRAVKITGPAAAIEAFGKALERTGGAFVDFGPAYRWAAIWFEHGSPLLQMLPTVGETWTNNGAYDGLSDALQHSISEEEYFQEIERQEAYRDWAERRYAAARGLA
jgi:hypothetical protein